MHTYITNFVSDDIGCLVDLLLFGYIHHIALAIATRLFDNLDGFRNACQEGIMMKLFDDPLECRVIQRLTLLVDVPDNDLGSHFSQSLSKKATKSVATTCDQCNVCVELLFGIAEGNVVKILKKATEN